MANLRRLVAVTLTIYWTVIFTGTHLPASSLRQIRAHDKILHWLAYGGLAFLLSVTVCSYRPRRGSLLAVGGLVAFYGAFDEWSQRFIPGRTSELWDWYADLLGAACGLGAYFVAAWIVRWRKQGGTFVKHTAGRST